MLDSLLVTFREGLESFLIIGVITAYLRKTDRAGLIRGVHVGLALSVVTCLGGAYLWLQVPNQPLYEGLAALAAAGLVGVLLWQTLRAGKQLKGHIEARVNKLVGDAPAGAGGRASLRALAGVALATTLLVTREGLEAVFYLGVKAFSAQGPTIIVGAVLGLVLAGVVAWTWTRFASRLNLGVVLKVTSLFLALFLAQLLVYGVHELAESGAFEGSQGFHDATELLGPDGRIGHFVSYSLLGAPLLYLFWARRAKLSRRSPRHPPPPEPPEETRTDAIRARSVHTCIRSRRCATAAVAMAILLSAGRAAAQATPKFEYGKADAVNGVEWKAQAKGGFLLTGGNSQTTGGTLSAGASRKQGNNKLTLDGGVTYGRSRILTPVLNATDPTIIDGVSRTSITNTNNWLTKGRYDRFFTTNNSGYVSAQAGADKIASKSFYGGGQIGYSRQLVKTDLHLLVAEIGYDLSHERYLQQPGKILDPVTIHSARVFVGETLTLSATTGITASVEALFNLNKEGSAINLDTRMRGVDAFKDTRALAKLGLTTTLRKSLSFGFGVTLKYDQNPAPLPLPPGTPAGTAYGPNFPFAEKLDTLAEATIIYTFL